MQSTKLYEVFRALKHTGIVEFLVCIEEYAFGLLRLLVSLFPLSGLLNISLDIVKVAHKAGWEVRDISKGCHCLINESSIYHFLVIAEIFLTLLAS